MTTDDHQRLRASLEECARQLSQTSHNGAPLRSLQRELVSLYGKAGTNVRIRAIAYMLHVWIDRYYSQLAGGIAPAISEQILNVRTEMLSSVVVPALVRLSTADATDSGVVWESMERLYISFLDAMGKVATLGTDFGK